MIQLVVKKICDSNIDLQQINYIYVSQSQKDIIKAVIRVVSENLRLSQHLVRSLLYKSIKLILFAYEYGNCYMFEQKFNSQGRRILYDKIRDQFLLLLGDIMHITPEQRQKMMELNDYFIPLVEEHYSGDQHQFYI